MNQDNVHILIQSNPLQNIILGVVVLIFGLVFTSIFGVANMSFVEMDLFTVIFAAGGILFIILGLSLIFGKRIIGYNPYTQMLIAQTKYLLYTYRNIRIHLDSISEIHIKKEIRVVHTKNGRHEYEEWILNAHLTDGSFKQLIESQDELQLRRYSETIAKTILKPINDFTTDPVTIRQPDQLDVPVADKLRSMQFNQLYQLSEDFIVKENRIGYDTVFTWSSFKIWTVFSFLIVSLIFFIIPLEIILEETDSGIMEIFEAENYPLFILFSSIFAVMSLLACATFMGTYQLIIGPRFVSQRYVVLIPLYSTQIPREYIEEIRVTRRLGHGPTVELISDEKSLVLGNLKSLENAHIFADRIKTCFVYS